MELLPADYVLCALALTMAVMGMFRGFSGTLAFWAAGAVAAVVGSVAWPYSETITPTVWMRAGLTLLAILLSFGLVRTIVRRFVHGLLAQPADALLGLLAGAATALVLVAGWAYSGFHLEYSNLATEVSAYVR